MFVGVDKDLIEGRNYFNSIQKFKKKNPQRHADGDSDLLHVVKKEIEEETGITKLNQLYDGIYGLNILTVEAHKKSRKQVNAHLHFDIEYLFEADENDKLSIKEDENSNVGWVPLDEVSNYTTEEKMKPIYSYLTEKLKMIKK